MSIHKFQFLKLRSSSSELDFLLMYAQVENRSTQVGTQDFHLHPTMRLDFTDSQICTRAGKQLLEDGQQIVLPRSHRIALLRVPITPQDCTFLKPRPKPSQKFCRIEVRVFFRFLEGIIDIANSKGLQLRQLLVNKTSVSGMLSRLCHLKGTITPHRSLQEIHMRTDV